MAVYVANLQIETGVDFEHLFSLGDNDNNTVLNLSNFSVASQFRKWAVAAPLYLLHLQYQVLWRGIAVSSPSLTTDIKWVGMYMM